MSHALSPGELLVFIYYLKRAFRPMRNFAKYTARLAKASAAGERVLELFDETPDIRDSEHAIKAPDLDGDIEFRNVSFSYDTDHSILNGIDLHIPAGQYVHIVGSSGNGKSTLASLLPRLYDPGNGAIFIDGRDIREYILASLRSQISVVLQYTLLFASSIRENIEAAARLANAHEFISLLPDGYDTIVGERGSTLSNGQRQRIAIARAAVRQTPILILDEPTVGLDPENEILVSDALERLASGRTTLHITHRLDSLSSDDYIICIQNGEIVEKGTKADLLARGGFFSQLGGQPFHQNLEQSGAA
jgi:ATP-binding cassette subfamily B protein